MLDIQVKGVNILLVDDHPASRKWVIYFLNNSPVEKKFHEVYDGFEAIKSLEKEHFDIIYLDVKMPGLNGMEIAKIIKDRFKDTKIIVFTMVDCRKTIVEMLEIGVEGYIVKEEDEIIRAFEEVVAGKKYFSPSIREVWIAYQMNGEINKPEVTSHSSPSKTDLKSRFRNLFTTLKSGFISNE